MPVPRSWSSPVNVAIARLLGRRAKVNLLLLVLVAVAVSVLCAWPLWKRAPGFALVPVFVSVSFCGSLLVLNDELGRGRGGATSILLVVAGLVWPTNYLYEWGTPLTIHLSMIGSTVFWWVSACACLMYPQQRLEGLERGYLVVQGLCLGGPEIYLVLTGETYDALPYFEYVALGFGIGFLGVMSIRYRRYKGVARKTLIPVLISGVALALTGAFSWFLLLSSGIYTPRVDQGLVDLVFCVQGCLLVVAAPIGLVVGGLRRRFIQAAVADALARLPPDAPPEVLREALRRALRDDRLDILYRSPNQGVYVNSDGHTVEPPEEDSDKVAIQLHAGGDRAMAVLVADRQLAGEVALFGDAVSAPRQPVLAVWLQVHERANREQQRALYRRLEEERWKERQRLSRDLHDGVQQHLYILGMCLALAGEQVKDDAAADSVERARGQLSAILPAFRDLIHDLAPPELARNGLGCAIHALVERQPISVDLHLGSARAPISVEYIAYLIICEALTNIIKHAVANQVVIMTAIRENGLELTISDNGIGGADMNRGIGLVSLRDRVQSVGGRLSLDSPPGSGTLIEARIPCE